MIDIEIKDHNQIKGFFHRLRNRLEDILFSIIQKIPEKFIPCRFMNRLERYLDRRIRELEQRSVKLTWQNMHLQNATAIIRSSK